MHCVNAPGRPGFESLRRNFLLRRTVFVVSFRLALCCLLIAFQFLAVFIVHFFFNFFLTFFSCNFCEIMTLVLSLLFHKKNSFFFLLLVTRLERSLNFKSKHQHKRRRRTTTKRTLIRFFIIESSP